MRREWAEVEEAERVARSVIKRTETARESRKRLGKAGGFHVTRTSEPVMITSRFEATELEMKTTEWVEQRSGEREYNYERL